MVYVGVPDDTQTESSFVESGKHSRIVLLIYISTDNEIHTYVRVFEGIYHALSCNVDVVDVQNHSQLYTVTSLSRPEAHGLSRCANSHPIVQCCIVVALGSKYGKLPDTVRWSCKMLLS